MTEDGPTAFRAVVRGRVQGVGFRDYVYMRALSLGVTGYVRNMADGRAVEVVAQGPRDTLDRLIVQLQSGPRSSRVDAVDVDWMPPSDDRREFQVRY
jgi:acylphosphatase